MLNMWAPLILCGVSLAVAAVATLPFRIAQGYQRSMLALDIYAAVIVVILVAAVLL